MGGGLRWVDILAVLKRGYDIESVGVEVEMWPSRGRSGVAAKVDEVVCAF